MIGETVFSATLDGSVGCQGVCALSDGLMGDHGAYLKPAASVASVVQLLKPGMFSISVQHWTRRAARCCNGSAWCRLVPGDALFGAVFRLDETRITLAQEMHKTNVRINVPTTTEMTIAGSPVPGGLVAGCFG